VTLRAIFRMFASPETRGPQGRGRWNDFCRGWRTGLRDDSRDYCGAEVAMGFGLEELAKPRRWRGGARPGGRASRPRARLSILPSGRSFRSPAARQGTIMVKITLWGEIIHEGAPPRGAPAAGAPVSGARATPFLACFCRGVWPTNCSYPGRSPDGANFRGGTRKWHRKRARRNCSAAPRRNSSR
jgi:hypothetical protein